MQKTAGVVGIGCGVATAIALCACGGSEQPGSTSVPQVDGGKDSTAAAVCRPSQVSCAGACVDPLTDPDHCGSCDVACGQGYVCSAGSCSLFCAGGATQCGSACVDLRDDPSHCGSCEARCN